jgi:hypothetical protein
MKEPELEEEVSPGARQEGELVLSRRTLAETVPPVAVTSPSGEVASVEMTEVAPGAGKGRWKRRRTASGGWRTAS